MMSTLVTEALEETRVAADCVDRLVHDAGWHLTRYGPTAVLEAAGEPLRLAAAIRGLAPLVTTAELVGAFSDASLTLRVAPDGTVSSAGAGTGDIAENFGVDDRTDAALAWGGNVDAALRLPGEWTCRAQLKWTAKLDEVAPSTSWLLFQSVDDVITYLRVRPFWSLQSELDTARGTVLLIRDARATASLTTPALTIAALESRQVTIPSGGVNPQERPLDRLLSGSIDPSLIMPGSCDNALMPVAEVLWSLVVATCWARLATSIEVDAASGGLKIEYFGLQRVQHVMAPSGPLATKEAAEDSLDLLRWVESASTVDRLLAVRQVVSLRTDEPPWVRVADVRPAAEPIFLALRSGAIAEALKAVRDARSSALEAARATVEVSAAIAKATVERILASLIAIGGVFIADTTKAIRPHQAADLRTLVSAALIGLGLWNVLIERPMLFQPIRDFRADLPALSELLPSQERRNVSNLQSLKNARRHALVLAWVTPLLYAGLAIASICVERK